MSRKSPPPRSKLERSRPLAYARRQKTGTDAPDDDDKPEVKPEAKAEAKETQGGMPIVEQLAALAKPEAPKPDEPEMDDFRSRSDTQLMHPLSKVGAPPDMPARAPATPKPAMTAVEDPTFMPGPREVPEGDPNEPAPPPGRVPRGDSRSLRRADEFALIYRVTTFVITRFGKLGTRGQWRVVEYPTSNAASHAYAKEASRFVSEGFSDYRDP